MQHPSDPDYGSNNPAKSSGLGAQPVMLTLPAFQQLAGELGGHPFVKVVIERANGCVHFISNDEYSFHADYIAERILGIKREELRARIDEFNQQVYLSEDRPYLLGIAALHKKDGEQFFTIETTEIDNMGKSMLLALYRTIKQKLDVALPLYLKPANHLQEAVVSTIDGTTLPRLYNHELYAINDFVALNKGTTTGRLRTFTVDSYRQDSSTIKWYDIVCMDRVPDDIPRVAGMINAQHTTPLSHTNVLAGGWGIPNAVQINARAQAIQDGLDGQWVRYEVDPRQPEIILEKIDAPSSLPQQPAWSVHSIRLEEPETVNTKVVSLGDLRMSERFRYGTKAANLGELRHVLDHGSSRLTGFYRVPRPPRHDLLQYLASAIGTKPDSGLTEKAWQYLRASVQVPRGIALPFSLQQEFLQSSWKIQQAIGRLKMALELNVKEVQALCVELQRLIRGTRFSDHLRDLIDEQITNHLAGVRNFVIRSSSNAEDLQDFSAAGIYESINHVTSAEKIFESIKEVWASLVSPRSVRLRQEVGISLDDCYMGVIIQEEVASDMGGVMVTTNPTNPHEDFRNVYINVSDKSAIEVVSGVSQPFQYLYNTVEGGGRTLAVGSSGLDLDDQKHEVLQRLAFCGRLLQSHFSQDYSFSSPADIEWAAFGDKLYILQLRPYSI